jgi:antibiotic biosynthesis monooxygenase (ABM) superfamily enzyme
MMNESGPLTVIVTWRIRQGCEPEFEAWRREISAAALSFPGHMGIDVIPPGANRGAGADFQAVALVAAKRER